MLIGHQKLFSVQRPNYKAGQEDVGEPDEEGATFESNESGSEESDSDFQDSDEESSGSEKMGRSMIGFRSTRIATKKRAMRDLLRK